MKYTKRPLKTYPFYDIYDFQANVVSIYENHPKASPHQKGAWVAAAAKRYKQHRLLDMLNDIASGLNLDLTPTMARHLLKGWIGRAVTHEVLIERFGEKGRTASDKSCDFEKLDDLIVRHKAKGERLMERSKKETDEVLVSLRALRVGEAPAKKRKPKKIEPVQKPEAQAEPAPRKRKTRKAPGSREKNKEFGLFS